MEKFWLACRNINGHNHQTLLGFKKKNKKPTVIIANTAKGKGISFMEDDNNWHYRIPTLREMEIAKRSLAYNAEFFFRGDHIISKK